MKRLGLRAKLSLIYMVLSAIVLATVGIVLYDSRIQSLNDTVHHELHQSAAGLWGYLHFQAGVPTIAYDQNDPEQAYFIATAGKYFQIYDTDNGRLLLSSSGLKSVGGEISAADISAAAVMPRFYDRNVDGQEMRFRDALMYGPANRPYFLRVATSLAPLQETRSEFLRTFLVVIPVGILLTGAGGWWIAKLALRPVDAMRAAAHQITVAKLERQLPVRGVGDEMDRLAETFNEAFARIHNTVEQMRSFSSAIAHELRTPITVMRGEAEIALLQAKSTEEYRAVLGSQLEELEKLGGLVDDLLLLARAEAGELPVQAQLINLNEFSQKLCQHLEPLATARSLSLQFVGTDEVFVDGDPRWLERAIFNLLDNALKFTPDGGLICLRISARDQSAVVEVTDNGVGIPPEAIQRVFDRFFRADKSRSRRIDGVGLGLTLAKTFVECHHGHIEVQSELGRGTTTRIYLPLTVNTASRMNSKTLGSHTSA